MFYTIQGYRFIGAILVLLFHMECSVSGYKGVDLFFVISGFVIYYSNSLKSDTRAATNFIVSRVSKVYLLYWSSLICMFLVQPFLINLSALKAFVLIPGHQSILGVSWSLSYELYFYFLFFLFFKKSGVLKSNIFFALLLASSTVITILLSTRFSVKGSWVNFFTGENVWQFLLGVLSAKIVLRVSGNEYYKLRYIIIIVLISLFLYLTISIRYNTSYSYLVYGLLSFFIVTGTALLERKKHFNESLKKILNILGNCSYAIYLFSPVFLILFQNKNFNNPILKILFIISASILINYYYENPFLKWIRSKMVILVQPLFHIRHSVHN